MSFDFINPLMLIGLAGVALPVLAHLLSRKKYDVVEWGAMQFLELRRNTRRRLRLEELLLLLLRMGLIALLSVSLARPWASGGWLSNLFSTQSRDVVIVIDGSYSMAWEGGAITPHAAAIRWVHRFLEELRAGDTVALLESRDQVRPVIESPTSDFGLVREELSKLPPPAGSSNLAEAAVRGVNILRASNNLVRDVVVLTDGQARGWSADDANLWTRFDDLLAQGSIRPRVWVIEVGHQAFRPSGDPADSPINFSVDRLRLSRELTVPEFPVRIKTKVMYFGGQEPVNRRVYLEVDGQRMSEKTLSVQLQPNGEASVEFEHRFQTAGSHLVSVVLDDDNLSGDNRADAALTVADALPALLVDGDPHLDGSRSETFFAKAALTAVANQTPWVRATVLPWDRLTPGHLTEPEVVILANVPRWQEEQTAALKSFVARGGGLLIALGDRVEADDYNQRLFESGWGVLPASIESVENGKQEESQGVRVLNSSLDLPWLRRFRDENDGGFTQARFSHWWRVSPASGSGLQITDSGDPKPEARSLEPGLPTVSEPIVAARLNNDDPLLMTRRYGLGSVLLMTAPIDADWSTLPAKPDYVSFLHEMIFDLASGKSARNVDVGMSLLLPVAADLPLDQYAFFGPGETRFPPEPAGDETRPLVRLTDTRLPGVYRFRPTEADVQATGDERVRNAEFGVRNRETGTPHSALRTPHSALPKPVAPEYFVVNFDRGESDLTPLDETDRELLTKGNRLAFAETLDELKQEISTDDRGTEIWYLLLLLFLAILVGEVVMTRRLVKGGHAVIDEDADNTPHHPVRRQ